MRIRPVATLKVLSALLMSSAMAQHGHPLAGIWLGDWGTAGNRSDVVLELYWMDTTLSGNINPGFPDAATIEVGELDSSNWTVHLEAASKDEAGNPVKVIVDGQIENLGSAKRTIIGTWNRGSDTGKFKLTRE